MGARWAAALLGLAMVAGMSMVSAKVVEYEWEVSYINAAPDCYSKTILGINGIYPGPTVRASQNDTVRVTMKNHVATEGITMHWHGIRQIGSPWADGTAAVSQCPIVYGESFTYEFTVDRPGTYFYHGHFGCQRAAGFYGSLIVDLPDGMYEPYHYEGEHMIIVNDWWHRGIIDQEQGLESTTFKWVGEPQSLLLEGRGRYNCSKVPKYDPAAISCNQTDERCAPHVWKVERGKTYRLRLASVASLSTLNFKIEGHMMQVVEADGHNIEPFYTDNIDIYSGETYSVLVHCNGTLDNYHLGLNVRGRTDKDVPTGLGILNYNNATAYQPNTPWPKGPAWDDFPASKAQAKKYKALRNNPDPTSHAFNKTEHAVTRTIILLNTQNKYQGHTKWAINNVTYAPLQTPLLAALVYNISGAVDLTPPPDYPTSGYNIFNPPANPNTNVGSGVYQFNTGDVVELILQNAATLTANQSEVHPWHLHGHDFWIMGYGDGVYDPIKSPFTFELDNPPARNNVPLFPFGWTAIRFKLDNPGAWPFHCHVEWHFHMGMGVMFAHGIDQVRQKGIPSSTLGCGLTKTLFKLNP
ncbi:hypothetical protein M758_11G144400 [Ceratodon purpureus]|nr:hypothetical protein M758_11G144400 [Ceratodon purpureus]